MTIPAYDELADALARADASLDASGCHGLVCGTLAAGGPVRPRLWLEEMLEEVDHGDVLCVELASLLQGMGETVHGQLHDPQMGFALLLPAEDMPMSDRVQALSAWCEGFLLGLGLSGISAQREIPGDSAEIIRDMAQITRAGVQAEPDEGDEAAYFELVEYLRVGVLLIREELRPPAPGAPAIR